MPVIQIDKNGFIKGTKRKFVMKVIIKKAMMIKGEFVPIGTTMDLEGAFLAECLSYNKVEQYQEPVKELSDAEANKIIANMEVDPVLDEKPVEMLNAQCSINNETPEQLNNEPKKLGPKRKKKTN